MNGEIRIESGFHSEVMVDAHIQSNDQYAGAFFTDAQNFVISGSEFKSITNVHHATPPAVSVASIRAFPVDDSGWQGTGERSLVMDDGWTRVDSWGNVDGSIRRRIFAKDPLLGRKGWIAQANYIFNGLDIIPNYDNYVLVDDIEYTLTLSDTGTSIPVCLRETMTPPGYLFLCPSAAHRSPTPPRFLRPETPAYWSRDPYGVEILSTEEAKHLGFPSLEFNMLVDGQSFDQSVYTGVRKFHAAEGFDSESEEVPQEFKNPFFRVTGKDDVESDHGSVHAAEGFDSESEEVLQEFKNPFFRVTGKDDVESDHGSVPETLPQCIGDAPFFFEHNDNSEDNDSSLWNRPPESAPQWHEGPRGSDVSECCYRCCSFDDTKQSGDFEAVAAFRNWELFGNWKVALSV
ncbi:hypothetical protein B0H13DRAFT_2666517, partial [Mycena leptocephala]